MKTKALVLRDIKKLELIERDLNLQNQDFVLLEVNFCGICRTDAKMWEIGHRDLVLPRVLGHEFCGKLEGTNDLFVVWPAVRCGSCDFCKKNKDNLCDKIRILGFHLDGGFAEAVYVPKDSLIPVSYRLPSYIFTFAEPIACSLNCVDNMVSSDDEVLILGAGVMGNLLSLCCKNKGANVYIYDPSDRRLCRTKSFRDKLGVNFFDIKHNNKLFDVVINATSMYSAFEMGISHLKKSGKFCFFSGVSKTDFLPTSIINEIHYKEITLRGFYGCTKFQMVNAIDLIKKYKTEIEDLIDGFITLEEVEKSFVKILNGENLKFIVNLKS